MIEIEYIIPGACVNQSLSMKTLFVSYTASDMLKTGSVGRPGNEATKVRMLAGLVTK